MQAATRNPQPPTRGQEIYKRLAEHLDNLPGGFPLTKDGLELRLLQRLFTQEEAELALYLTLLPEEPRGVNQVNGLPRDETAQCLEQMAKRELVLMMVEASKVKNGGQNSTSGHNDRR